MARLIDAEALVERLSDFLARNYEPLYDLDDISELKWPIKHEQQKVAWMKVLRTVMDAEPTVDAIPIDWPPKVVELGKILTASGAGYLEDHYLTEDGELRQTLTDCAWLHGVVMDGDGCRIEMSYLRKKYGKTRGLRIWDGKPTDAQRKAVPWDAD